MSRRQRTRLSLFFILLFSVLALIVVGQLAAASGAAKFGDLFPDYTFHSPKASDDRAYLGIGEGETFAIGDIHADLIVVEVLNIYCTSCQMQAPVYNEVVSLLEDDPVTKGRVKWMGVGVGNNEKEVATFKERKHVAFPVLTDVDFKFYDAVGGPGGVRTPLTILVRKDEKRRGIVVDSHVGFRRNKEEIIEGIQAALQYDLAYLKITEGERTILPPTERLTPPLSDDELLRQVRNGMTIGNATVLEVRRITPHGEIVYVGKILIDSGEKQLFAKVVSRPPVCDICHDIHFIYVFDEAGEVKNFIPIHLTKAGNRLWTDEDNEQMKRTLIGRSILQPFRFNREVDAVSRATITSVVIFDAMNRGRSTYADLKEENYID